MNIIRHWFHLFYKTMIHPLDPAFFVTRYAAKSVLACVLALLAAYLFRLPAQLLPWSVFGAFIVMLSRAGGTFRERKIVAIKIIVITSALVPFSTAVGGTPVLREIYVFILAFAAFFSGALGFSSGVIGMGVLILNLLALGSPDTFPGGIQRSMTVISGGLIAYMVNFRLWPVHPERVLVKAGAVALTDLGDFFRVVIRKIEGRKGPGDVEKYQARATVSVRRYRQIMEAMNLDPLGDPHDASGFTAMYSVLVRVKTAVVGLDNSSSFNEDNPLFIGVRDGFADLASQASDFFHRLTDALKVGTPMASMNIGASVDALENQLLDLGAYKRGEAVKEEFLQAWGAIHALRHLSLELENIAALSQGAKL